MQNAAEFFLSNFYGFIVLPYDLIDSVGGVRLEGSLAESKQKKEPAKPKPTVGSQIAIRSNFPETWIWIDASVK